MRGKVNTIVVGTGTLDNFDIQRMMGWAANKFGQLDLLPEGHRYRTAVPLDSDTWRPDGAEPLLPPTELTITVEGEDNGGGGGLN